MNKFIKKKSKKIFGMSYNQALLAFVLLIGIYKLILLIGTYPSGDACHHLAVSRYIAENNALPTFVNLVSDCFARPPLFHIISAILYLIGSIFGQSIATFMMSLTSLIFSSLTIILVYMIARKFYDENISLLSAVLFGVLPIVLELSVQAYVDITLTALTLLAVYLCMTKRYFWAAVVFGLGLLSNLNSVFIFPLLLYICYNNISHSESKKRAKMSVFMSVFIKFIKIVSLFFISLLIASPQYIYTYQNFGNPIWSYMNQVFHGRTDYAEVLSFNEYSLPFSIGWFGKQAAVVYTEVFGLPSGNIDYLDNFGDMKYILYIWFFVNIFWILFLILGIKRELYAKRAFFLIWMIPYFLLLIYYLFTITSNVVTHSRYLLPAIPAMCIIISAELMNARYSLFRLQRKSPKSFLSKNLHIILRSIVVVFLILFVLTALPKLYFNNKTWDGPVGEMHNIWESENIPLDAKVLSSNGCLIYQIHGKNVAFTTDKRLKDNPGQYYYDMSSGEGIVEEKQLGKVDYILHNKDLSEAGHANDLITKLLYQNRIIEIYEDSKTETKVYKVMHEP